ncbi:MAG: hypothetical protein LBH92_09380 [Bacteroidales bacterium]|jgi:hypothetical protein|nr:hypothetical protein [Bacteroidales bacterium]
MSDIVIFGICIRRDVVDVLKFQNLLTTYGNIIRTRLGLHEGHYETGSIKGLLLLELAGDMEQIEAFEKAVKEIKGMEIQKMNFAI